MGDESDWLSASSAWKMFVEKHTELGYKVSYVAFHNFLRLHRDSLKQADVIRLAKRQFWIAHKDRFCSVAFDCATGVLPKP